MRCERPGGLPRFGGGGMKDRRRDIVPVALARVQDNPAAPAASREFLSCPRADRCCAGGGVDPYREHCQFPDRWRAYLSAHFGNRPDVVALAFGVTERAARKWLAGETGCKGGAVAIAVQLHPVTAPQMLWAAE